MTTKAPPAVQEAAPGTLEKIAYASVTGIATVEPNDLQRLGYHVWRWLSTKDGTIEQAVVESGARLKGSPAEAAARIAESLKQHGITAP